MRIGIDVGGTNTDAALIDDDGKVLATVKSPTTQDVTGGVAAALAGLGATEVSAVMIGTTHFVNALVEVARLEPVAAVRLGLPATAALPPLVDWPGRLREVVEGATYLCHGGHEYDGTPISDLDPGELRKVAADIRRRGLRSVAISSVFSPVSADSEVRAAEILAAELGPGVHLSVSSEIGRVGLLARENATIVNAALSRLAVRTVEAFGRALRVAGIDAPLFLSQNDGTLMDVAHARRYPVLTFASGPTNSMRGAAYLSGLSDCAVVDIGGTTTDVGILAGGFPREAAGEALVAEVRTNFRIPDVLSIGIGGGSVIAADGTAGPRSVGYRLTEQALVFGGSTLTATDLAVAAGRAAIGDPGRVSGVSCAGPLKDIEARVAEAVDRMRTSPAPLPVVLVGGGSILIDTLPGFADVRRPDHFEVANAVGAAIAQVGGEVDRVFSGPREAVLREAKDEATARAERAGARTGSVRIVDVEELPLAYLPGDATRVRVKAVGDLDLEKINA
ncbi:hydantoinase/oxoprolinase N-terminal domain-containing protein [Nonomuraea sp. NPDC050540]|uniref:hydantoinase/oxoprolinase N-terminal domain-containing protein n=1 Tax=Nonomuraea sp. NPDC050540 TaxID=3364367 RepID=UPI0037BD68B6